jgi:HEAT repeat protein
MPEISALREYDVQYITGAMLAILAHVESDARTYVIDALTYLVPRDVMIDLLLPCLSDPSPEIRWSVCEAINGNPDPRVVLSLVKVLQDDDDPDVRVVAVEALSSVGDERALPALAYAEKHDKGKDYEDRTVANAAREAIAAIRKRTNSRSVSVSD